MGLFVCFVVRISAMLQVFSRFFGKSLNLCYIYSNYDFLTCYSILLIRHIFQFALHVCMHENYYMQDIISKFFFYISIKKNRYQGIIILHNFLKKIPTFEFCREKFETFFSALYLSVFISCFCVNGIIQLRKTTPQVTFKG